MTKLVDESIGDDENWSTSQSATTKPSNESIGDDRLVDELTGDDEARTTT